MSASRWTSRLLKLALSVCLGGTLLSTSCGEDIRNSVKAAGLDFVEGAASDLLDTLFPVQDILAGDGA